MASLDCRNRQRDPGLEPSDNAISWTAAGLLEHGLPRETAPSAGRSATATRTGTERARWLGSPTDWSTTILTQEEE